MKLDKWPEEIECDGWRWKLTMHHTFKNDVTEYQTPMYFRKEKLYVPPTMKEIMEHLLKGGWVKYDDPHEEFRTIYYYKEEYGEIRSIQQCRRTLELGAWVLGSRSLFAGMFRGNFYLIQPYEWENKK